MNIGWIDYSKEEKNKITTILGLLGEQGTLDELGIGVIRNAFSEALFPGISTLYTRAKYFVLIPYLFSEIIKQRNIKNPSEFRRWFDRREDELIDVLIKNSQKDAYGILGRVVRKQGKSLRYKPSTIYWNGLKTLEIIRHLDFSIDDACNLLSRKQNRQKEIIPKSEGVNEAGDDEDVLMDGYSLFTPINPGYDVMREATISLTYEEAEYIKERFIESPHTQNSLGAYLLRHDVVAESLDQLNLNELPSDLRKTVVLAKEFTLFVYGAYKLYNMIFSNYEDEQITKDFNEWIDNDYRAFDLDSIIDFSRCPKATSNFLRDINTALNERDITAAEKIIINREKFTKRDRAKLLKPNEYRYENPVHNHKLNYRFDTANIIINDIRKGLKEKV